MEYAAGILGGGGILQPISDYLYKQTQVWVVSMRVVITAQRKQMNRRQGFGNF